MKQIDINFSVKLSEIGAGTKKEQVGLIYGQKILIEVEVFLFSSKSNLTFIMKTDNLQ